MTKSHRAMRNASIAGLIGAVLVSAASAQSGPSISTYHGALDRAGHYVVPALTRERARGLHLDASFHASFAGAVYAQPLFWPASNSGAEMLIVATEDNDVYALDAHSGATIWKRALGPPVPRSALPCGNISPLGVTGTPVIDEAGATLYLDAAVVRADGPRHEIYALALADGSIRSGWPLDVATAVSGFAPRLQHQRGALALFDGAVFVPFSGHWGDCGDYHGYVVGVSTTEPGKATSFSTRARGGGVWAQGGVSGDGRSLFAATGNTFGAQSWSDGEAVIRFGRDLARPTETRDYFAPSDWLELDERDLDLGGTAPTPFDVAGAKGGRRLIFAIGKSGEGYLLDRDDLGGIGGAAAAAERLTTNVEIAAPAIWTAADGVLVAIQGKGAHCPREKPGQGLIALRIRADPALAIETAWCGAVAGNGSPIVTTTDSGSDPIVWIVGAEGDDELHAFDGETGEPLAVAPVRMRGLHHFQTLIATADRLYVAADGTVYAFAF